jgi:adenylate cyclase
LDGLVVAEIEFPSEEDAKAFQPPHWLGEEVTGDHRYMNETLATKGLPGARFRSS